MELNGLGVFAFLDSMSIADAGAFAQRAEKLGYAALWFTEGPGRDALVHGAYLLTRTERLIIGSGVASVWARGPLAMASAAWTNAEASGGRFVLGIGINNPESAAARGGTYSKPLAYMADYLGKLKSFKYAAAGTATAPPIVIGAQNRGMLELAGKQADGALTYFATPAHTALARRLLGPQRRLLVEQAVMLERDATRARQCARNYIAFYLTIPNYGKFLASIGFDANDLTGGGSDRLVDAIVAWGDESRIRARLDEHRHAGADHVCILPLDPAGGMRPCSRALEALAPS
jgi:probable F420-dependent oxidoreductase